KFKKARRTMSFNIFGDYNPKNANGTLYSFNKYYFTNDSALLDQMNTQQNLGLTVSPNLSYTEPISSKGQLMFTYNPSLTRSNTEKLTFDAGYVDLLLNTDLSNKFDNTYLYERGGVSYRHNTQKMNFMAGTNFQYATLTGTETFPA